MADGERAGGGRSAALPAVWRPQVSGPARRARAPRSSWSPSPSGALGSRTPGSSRASASAPQGPGTSCQPEPGCGAGSRLPGLRLRKPLALPPGEATWDLTFCLSFWFALAPDVAPGWERFPNQPPVARASLCPGVSWPVLHGDGALYLPASPEDASQPPAPSLQDVHPDVPVFYPPPQSSLLPRLHLFLVSRTLPSGIFLSASSLYPYRMFFP